MQLLVWVLGQYSVLPLVIPMAPCPMLPPYSGPYHCCPMDATWPMPPRGLGCLLLMGELSLSLLSLLSSSGPHCPCPVVILIFFLVPVIIVTGWSWYCQWSWLSCHHCCWHHCLFLLANILVLFVHLLLSLPSLFLSSCHPCYPLTHPGPCCCHLLCQASPFTLWAVAHSGSWGCCGGGGVIGHGLVVLASLYHCNTVRSPRLM